MDDDGQGARGTRDAWREGGHADGRRSPVPRPAGPPPPVAPPMPTGPARVGTPTVQWLNEARPTAGPGAWRYAYVPRPAEKPPRPSLAGPGIALGIWLLAWVMLADMRVPYVRAPLMVLTPDEWWALGQIRGSAPNVAHSIQTLYNQVLIVLFGLWAARIGNWAGLFRYYAGPGPSPARLIASAVGAVLALWLVRSDTVPILLLVLPPVIGWATAGGSAYLANVAVYAVSTLIFAGALWPVARAGRWYEGAREARVVVAAGWPFARAGQWRAAVRAAREHMAGGPSRAPAARPGSVGSDRAGWPELRASGFTEAADVLSAAVRAGRMNDVDCVRLDHAWTLARTSRSADFATTVVRQGPDAFLHPSGRRDLPLRAACHDLLTGQVRIGTCVDDERNPYTHRGAGVALDPAVLGTSLLAVGPAGAGKTSRLVRPVIETLSLQALAGKTAVLAVGAAGAGLGQDDAYDVVVKIGDASSLHDFDLYGGTTDPDEAAATLAEGLVGDVPGLDSRRAALALGQLLGPYRAVHGCFPSVAELRELLVGSETALLALRQAVETGGHHAMLRELDARTRHTGGGGDPTALLADRIALLDRPAFAGFFATDETARPFSLRSLEQHPLRVRIDLPERAHAGASRVLARLVLAQFNAIAALRTDRSLFTCLVLDDATHTLTAETVRGLRHLRSVNAGAVLALRTVADVPEELHSALLGSVGCGMIFPGVTTWDGKRFAEAWGKEWVEVREVAQHGVFADQPFTRALHALRKLATGKAVTTDAVTVRQEERERWSASALAYQLPPGHAVVSVTTVDGEHAPPLLVELSG